MPPTMALRSSSGTPAISCRQQLLAAAEGALGVGVVVAPHDRRQPGDVPAGDGDGVVLERHVELALHVLARHQRVRPLLVEPEQLGHAGLVVVGTGRRPTRRSTSRRPGRCR